MLPWKSLKVLGMIINTLFTSVGRRVELMDAWRRAYKDLGVDGKIVGTDIDPLAPALRGVDIGYIVPIVTSAGFVTSLEKICKREQVHLIFPLIDPDIPVLAENRERLESHGAKLVVSPIESVCTTRDKWLTSAFFNEIGVASPASWLPGTFDPAELEYPVFIKPRHGSAAKETHKVNTAADMNYFLATVDNPVIQEFLPGPEITNDVVCDFDGKVLNVVLRQRIEVRWGEVAKGKTIFNQDIINDCVTIAKRLKAIGPITIQCITKDDRHYFTEINMRYGGGAPLGIAAGVDSPRWYLALISGKEVDIPPLGSYRENLYLSRYDTSTFLSEDDLNRIKSSRI